MKILAISPLWRMTDVWLLLVFLNCHILRSLCKEVVTNSWLVTLHGDGGEEIAKRVAKNTGFSYIGPVLNSKTDFHFVHHAVHNARMRRSVPHTRLLKSDPMVRFAVQQTGFPRLKRGYKPLKPLSHAKSNKAKAAAPPKTSVPTDPLYPKQWYLNNTAQAGGKLKLDLNVEAAWALGITGKGVTTAIMDDGIDYMHPDLYENFNAEASYDFSSNDPYPYPRYTDDWFNSHGTRCAGEIAAKRDNGVGGVGVAYGSRVAGLRMLDQPYMTDLIEANSMGHEPQKIDIYSASWGPTDDGKTVDGPRNLTMKAIVYGVNEGRQGKGNIYVWASGDGGPDDDCNCDGYAASMWTVSINSATNDGQTAGYDESCSSTLASTFSNGKSSIYDAGVATTDLYGNVTTKHSGTSAAAPEAAGVFALALEANPDLTWRDIQHLTVLTSKRNSLFDPEGRFLWMVNGAGLEFNHLFGYGVLDAGSIVDLAGKWKSVPERFHCSSGTVQGKHKFKTNEPLLLIIDTDACQDKDNEINYLEHVQAFITINASRRGDVTMYLTSPMGTKTMILSRRPRDDDSTSGFIKWPFMTTHMWAENPQGPWRLEVVMETAPVTGLEQEGNLFEWTLMLHGVRDAPYAKLPVDAVTNHEKLGVVKRAHERFIARSARV
ncbi:LOW QUALITY PROTEIN: neuroendocrine convertase 2-like [Lingula anatina]|uniref:Neuroendocrine convertase 2 n=1 Tax=Lingula anatina TaxID=7574 RepID=A0A1S3KAL3_LINAN|nr:LOW QUALITY PROTEIN: neuroendocrine convertase 2-like [Lingula anatina]|eukprot:XP_013419660.1 LOW QUALITY PROTEIN: neuroendocrine convertase 2-like [Lingula anatina]